MKRNKRIISLLWALLLFGFTVYAALDTFVIKHSYVVVEETPPTTQTAETARTAEAVVDAMPGATAMQPATVAASVSRP